ncbi:protein of unknown function [Shewanella benthica]|uniref:Uncharacterized protein n=1 Tax=Shewanella benthica TaxID=43661 RepID=A0A330M484_9GAMM|nr:protein of unknown function [Shewanella benthica]
MSVKLYRFERKIMQHDNEDRLNPTQIFELTIHLAITFFYLFLFN